MAGPWASCACELGNLSTIVRGPAILVNAHDGGAFSPARFATAGVSRAGNSFVIINSFGAEEIQETARSRPGAQPNPYLKVARVNCRSGTRTNEPTLTLTRLCLSRLPAV